MAQLKWIVSPGAVDIPDAVIAADQPLTDDSIQKISHNAKFGAVRFEAIYCGWFKHGDTIPLPVSPVDGYAYARTEIEYVIMAQTTYPPAAGFVSGQQVTPTPAPASGVGINASTFYVNQTSGVVWCGQYYNSTGSTINDGMVQILAICQRLSVSSHT